MGYTASLRHEAFSCFRGRWFRVSLIVAVGLAIAAGIEGVVRAFHWYNLDPFYLSGHSAYSAWMVANCPIATLPTVFFYLLPFIVLIPFAWSFRGERMSGYDIQVISRISRRDRILAKGTIVFVSAALITALAHVINFVVVSLFLPLRTPVFEEVFTLGIFTECLFSGLFYSRPLLYVLAFTAMNSILMGAWATLVLGVSAISSNRVSLLVFPYLALVVWRYFNSWVWSVTMLHLPSFNIIDDMQGTYWTVRSDPLVILIEFALMLIAAYLLCRHLARADVI